MPTGRSFMRQVPAGKSCTFSSGSLLIVSDKPLQLKKLRPAGAKLLSEDQNFRVAYNRFINALTTAGIELNRKMLSELAISDPAAFDAIVEMAKPHLNQPASQAA